MYLQWLVILRMGTDSHALDVYKTFKERYQKLKDTYGAKDGNELNPRKKLGKLFITSKEENIIFSKMGIDCERTSLRKLSIELGDSYNSVQRRYKRGISILRKYVNYFTE